MFRVLTPSQMSQAEKGSEKLGVSLWELMKNAGAALCRETKNSAAETGARSILLLCGKGNNGGDGFVCARLLHELGFEVSVRLMCGEPDTELSARAFAELPQELSVIRGCDTEPTADIIVDCIFGTGFHGEFRGDMEEKLSAYKDKYVIACDMPSGVDALRGTAASGTLVSDRTVTFHAPKLGMLLKPARNYCGKITSCDIGIPSDWVRYCGNETYSAELTADILHDRMPPRPEYSHKGTFGRLLIIAGSESYIGAAAICSRAALRSGCGIVNLAAPRSAVTAIANGAPECVYTALPADGNGFISEAALPRINELAALSDAIVVGCGLGRTDDTAKIVEHLVKTSNKPLLIDADGINQLSLNIDVLRDKNCEIILTPHLGELGRLCGVSASEARQRRYELCRQLCEKYSVCVHSKDATSITFDNSRAYITDFGCSALAKGGSGDMLAGVIGSLLAQRLSPIDACAVGDYIVGRTAELLCETKSPAAVIASDIIEAFKDTLTIL